MEFTKHSFGLDSQCCKVNTKNSPARRSTSELTSYRPVAGVLRQCLKPGQHLCISIIEIQQSLEGLLVANQSWQMICPEGGRDTGRDNSGVCPCVMCMWSRLAWGNVSCSGFIVVGRSIQQRVSPLSAADVGACCSGFRVACTVEL